VVDAVRVPEVPVIVTVAAPMVAVLLAVSVSTLEPVVGLVAKAAVTPEGRPEAASVYAGRESISTGHRNCVSRITALSNRQRGCRWCKREARRHIDGEGKVVDAVRVPEVPVIVNRGRAGSGRVAGGQRQHAGTGGGVGGEGRRDSARQAEAASITPPVNPPTSVTEMVLVPLLP